MERNLRSGNVSREDLAAKRMPYNPSLPPLVLHGAACRTDLGDNKAEAHRSMPFAPRLSCGAPVLLVATASRSLQSYIRTFRLRHRSGYHLTPPQGLVRHLPLGPVRTLSTRLTTRCPSPEASQEAGRTGRRRCEPTCRTAPSSEAGSDLFSAIEVEDASR